MARTLAGRMGNLSTAGFWLAPDQPLWLSTEDISDNHAWFNLLEGPRGPLEDLRFFSLDEPHGELAVAVALRSLFGPTEMTASEPRR